MEWIKDKKSHVLPLAVCDIVITQYGKGTDYQMQVISLLYIPPHSLDTPDLDIAKERAVAKLKEYLKVRHNLIKETLEQLNAELSDILPPLK